MAEPMTFSADGKTLIVILSMHRSGSSLAAAALARLGMSLGPFELLGSNEHNKHGHFEAMPLFELDMELLDQVFGFRLDVPESPEVLSRFCASDGRWTLGSCPISAESIEQGKAFVQALTASGPVSGFKDPRVPLLWPFWEHVLSAFPGLRVVPLLVLRSPHEIAMSIFMRAGGAIRYGDALDVTAVHYRRMLDIMENWRGDRAVVRFAPQMFAEDLRCAAEICNLAWNAEAAAEAYDGSCRHHEAAAVLHPAEDAYRRIAGLPPAGRDPSNLERLLRDAAAREAILSDRGNHFCAELHTERLRHVQVEYELHSKIAELQSELALITNSRTWRWRERMVRLSGRKSPGRSASPAG